MHRVVRGDFDIKVGWGKVINRDFSLGGPITPMWEGHMSPKCVEGGGRLASNLLKNVIFF